MVGFLIPPWFADQQPSNLDMNVASIIWGISLATALFTTSKAGKQSWAIWKRNQSINAYVVLVWLEWTASLIMSVICWFYLWGTIESSFPFFFAVVTVWMFQTQCVVQIIINRISLLMRDKRRINRIKWGVFATMSMINISVYCVWIPARLQINTTWIVTNEIWDRVEKVIFCLIDASLNLYFIYLVRSKLIANGLTKYNKLFRFNLFIIAISMSLDVILIGVMSLGQGFIYVQFHPLVYFLKLHIELNMADLIAKVVRTDKAHSYPFGSKDNGKYSKYGENGTSADPRGTRVATTITANPNFELADMENGKSGIQKTVETQIRLDDDCASQSSSTTELQRHYNIV
ncbi:hypothetical protein F5Y15DRAFT_225771 [Xylariaceae sp. FL0016]|nr:hypothetical protein F5Y15DRAFT_225771 [Xylariaceae sp. FL0016]